MHAGTVVQDGSVLFRASAVGSHTTLSRIIRMVRQAQSSKPEIYTASDIRLGMPQPDGGESQASGLTLVSVAVLARAWKR